MKKSIDINSKFGDLTVIEFLGIKNYNNAYLCRCICGNQRVVKLTNLISSKVTNCGCKNFVSKAHGNRKFEPTEASFRAKASSYKALAKKRNIEFKLSIDETVNLLKQKCYYCNSDPSNYYNARIRNRVNKKNKIQYAVNNSKEYDIYYNGIDRIDNTKGYEISNTVSCCNKCNTAKLNYTIDEFKTLIKNIYFNFILRNENISHI